MHIFSAFALASALFTSLAASAAIELEKRGSPIAITLAEAGNAMVEVTMTNTGATDLSLYKYGTIMEAGPVQKVSVYKDGVILPHEGVLRRYLTTNLNEDAFTTLAAGKSVVETINLPTIADFSAGGTYEVEASGAIPLATLGTTTLSGQAVTYASNKLTITVNGAEASKVEKAFKPLDKRTVVQSGCSSAQNTALRNALSNAVSLANAAATAATSGSASKFNEYFKTTSSSVRSTVAARFRGVVTQASSTTSGGTKYYCTDVYGDCGSK